MSQTREFKPPPDCEILNKSRHGYMVGEVDDIVSDKSNNPGYDHDLSVIINDGEKIQPKRKRGNGHLPFRANSLLR